ncbi:phage minor capsid protein [Lacticaseibacillus daqingensis]|uniref:phage minor capsid protein n=1 Tax=Lacticaseibacillus daqingensis TaxID=2486014 RepID=UPI000F7920B2|nr:phage minor capsid protein [Lacticaseibacillus daqingensis]
MPKVTQHQLETQQALIGDIYAHLEQAIFQAFVKRLSAHGIADYDETNILQWQMMVLNDLNLVNDDVVAELVKATGLAKEQITDLFQTGGYSIVSQQYGALAKATGRKIKPNLIKQVLDGYQSQTFLDLDNNINQTLLSTNAAQNPAVETFQQIAKETTAEVITGLKTPTKALSDTIYKWRDKGISRGLVDKGGHTWSLESYARMVINTTSNRAFQAVRDQAAADYGVDIFLMSSHAASREACAPIQGKLVTTRTTGFVTSDGDVVYPLDSYGYGEPGGTFGINCMHIKWPFIPGVNTNHQEQFDPKEAAERGHVQQKQRALERRVRGYKNQLELAERLDDDKGKQKYKLLIRKNQAALRQLVKDNDFLARDYSREKRYPIPTADSKTVYAKQWHAEVQKSLGKAGVPDEAAFVSAVRKGGREGRLLRRYITARRERLIEPVAGFDLYKELDQAMASQLHGVTAANGMTVTGHSLHSIERVIGTKYYHDQNGKVQHRDGVTINAIRDSLEGGKIQVDSKRHSTRFETNQCVVVLNQDGEIITVYPR